MNKQLWQSVIMAHIREYQFKAALLKGDHYRESFVLLGWFQITEHDNQSVLRGKEKYRS